MRWLRFANSYVDTGIKPSAGYKMTAKVRAKYVVGDYAVMGSRGTAGTSDNKAFCMFHLFDFGTPPLYVSTEYFRMDYAKTGTVRFNTDNTNAKLSFKYFDFTLASTCEVNGVTEVGGTSIGNTYNIYIGSINNAGSADTRYSQQIDFSDVTIYDASGVAVFDAVPVPAGSTEFSGTPAPSNCFWDKVSSSYKGRTGGSGVGTILGYEDDTVATTPIIERAGADYGIKVLSDDTDPYEIMNGKHKLFGTDLSNKNSQFKTYEFTLTGYSPEPVISFPAYVRDWNFYYGEGSRKIERQVIATGLDPKTIKSVFVTVDPVTDSNWQGRAHQKLDFDITGEHYDTYINPSSKTAPGYLSVSTTQLMFESNYTDELGVLLGQQGITNYNTLGSFNGGTISENYFEIPQVSYKIDALGNLRVSTSVPYKWIQRASDTGSNYFCRWYDWTWFQGITIRITILSTPYIL